MPNEPRFISLNSESGAVTLPPFCEREELAVAYSECGKRGGMAVLRVLAAAIGLSTKWGSRAGADYDRCGCSPTAYGGKVYSYLRAQGVPTGEIASAGSEIIVLICENLAPRETEVAAKAGFTEAGEQ